MAGEWKKVIPLASLPPNDVAAAQIEGQEIALYRVDDVVYATDNVCTHGHALLCDGFLEGHEIECPLHQGRFDVRTGKAMCEPLTTDIRTFSVKVEAGDVYIHLDGV
ncbi:MAG: Probable ferredoxin subunit of a ring-hydroxylating dioxygenase oxidoreductase protein (EC [uncultured Paraburkholderia sp.]|uniref:non-heme iron oxygenase ferredoxin subunit n=1 Tax=uncultured Paraburkholderia sp. TaxID=1822466 RepID=UPI002595CFB3|nr:non-heme iron oxygenase ferredoxin subunit [uncultured Paraburkholderia sp.]CAH2904331.1 MAG: Probable ferredoxin subunit of a ring-hydroxylating dioxygenase oxidoreductase protein (EC [uncultured Paraburkholderia sp.]CAH2943178.1 MAG: Probable ferredoxin subunit of a ring-hydroxylating dioxygenase oxidoreductase protein (EC [uncultured Paraburkholderia sp.]